MSITNALACLLVAADCAYVALGGEPDRLFGARYRWIWWFAVVGWGMATVANIVTALQ